jgi:uncharacterized SAM-binding protein YcdF (DUF218 family)
MTVIILKRAMEFFLEPGNGLVVLLAIGAGLLWTNWRRAGAWLTSLAAVLFVVLLVLPLGAWVLKPLEDAYPRSGWPPKVDGILVLGGGMDPAIVASRRAPSEDLVEGRLVGAVELARRYPDARVVFAGGSGAIFGDRMPEAGAARQAFAALGIESDRIVYESRSTDSWENLLFAQRLVRPKVGEVWVLATSASQLPRAMSVARRIGWRLIPWSTDYATPGNARQIWPGFDLADNLGKLDAGLHEWTGIVAYRLTGRATAR